MKKNSEATPEMTLGLDLGDRYSYYVVVDGTGSLG